MSTGTWKAQSELLDSFLSTIDQQTHGRLSNLSFDIVDGMLVIEASCTTYYAVQLALVAIQAFTADAPQIAPSKLVFCVNGSRFSLHNPCSALVTGRVPAGNGKLESSGRLSVRPR
jgi:hypothetical protein